MKVIPALLILASIPCAFGDDPPQPQVAPTHADVAYGPHQRNVLDFWKAEGNGPRPLLIAIHGGGWVGGDKRQKAETVQHWLKKGVSYAAINYRLTVTDPLPA